MSTRFGFGKNENVVATTASFVKQYSTVYSYKLCTMYHIMFRYPLYQRGNPQLRIFLPNFWMKLLPPDPQNKQPPNIVLFHCSLEMTKYDVRNYLEKIYNVNIVDVRTEIQVGKFKRDRLQGAVIKDDDMNIATVILPKDQSFVFPDMFKDVKDELDEESINESKKDLERFIGSSKAPGLPAWFRT